MSNRLTMKILIAGDGGVGKTTFLYRYKEGRFLEDTSMTIGVDFSLKSIIIDDNTVEMQIWDFGGQDRFRFMLPRYTEGAQGALVLADLTRLATFSNIKEWVNIIRASEEELPILLVGTKNDLHDDIQVDDEFALELKEKYNIFNYMKTSSKTGENIEKSFELLVRKVIGI